MAASDIKVKVTDSLSELSHYDAETLRKRVKDLVQEREALLSDKVKAEEYAHYVKSQLAQFEQMNSNLNFAINNLSVQYPTDLTSVTGDMLKSMATNAKATKKALQSSQVGLTEFIKTIRNISPDLNETADEFVIVKKLSPSPRGARKAYVGLKTSFYTAPEIELLRNFPLFQTFPAECLQKISETAMEVRKRAGDLIVGKGEHSHEMFFLIEGKVSVLNKVGNSISVLNAGSFFGELGFLFRCARTATVTANEDCIIIVITYQRFNDVLLRYPDLTEKVAAFAETKKDWIQQQKYVEDDTFGAEFVGSIARENLISMDIFSGLDVAFIERLTMCMTGECYPAGHKILKVNDDSNCMYFIMNGKVEVIGENDCVHAEMGSGSFFGEVGILFELKRTATVRAKEACTLLKLTKSNLEIVSKDFPSISAKIKAQADERHKLYLSRTHIKPDAPAVNLFDVEVNEQNLRKLQLFSTLESNTLSELALSMTRKSYKKGEYIIRVGDQADSMFFLGTGDVEVISEFDEVIDHAQGPSAWFGEVGILQNLPRTASIRATSVCSVFELKKSKVQELMAQQPHIAGKILETSEDRLQKYLMRNILA